MNWYGRGAVERHLTALERAYKRFEKLTWEQDDLKADLTKYLCIRTSAVVEQCVFELLMDFARKKSTAEIVRFVEQKLNRFQNPSFPKVLELLNEFDSAWKEALQKAVRSEEVEALNSVVSLRHKFAHGDDFASSVSFVPLTKHFEKIRAICQILCDLLDPDNGRPGLLSKRLAEVKASAAPP